MNENKKKPDAASLGVLQLAYMGDAVMELFAREVLLAQGNFPPGKLVKMSKSFVTCEAQSDALERILPYLTDAENSVFKRGRNAKTHFTPSHGELIQYRRATGMEALFGYLYISGKEARARELFDIAYDGEAEKAAEALKK